MLFSRWLGRQAVRLRRVSSEHPARYLRSRARRVQVQKGDSAALRQLIDFLRRHGVIPAEEIAPRRLSPVDQTVQAFVRDERALVVAAIERDGIVVVSRMPLTPSGTTSDGSCVSPAKPSNRVPRLFHLDVVRLRDPRNTHGGHRARHRTPYPSAPCRWAER